MVAAHLLHVGMVDAVWLVPVYLHAFEGQQDKQLAPFSDRVRWCEALAEDVGPGVRVCQVESALPVPSYTIDTLRHLSGAHPGHSFRLVVGADVVPQLPRWHDWHGIVRDFSPILVGREGHALESIPEGLTWAGRSFPGVSSTEVRERLAAGGDVAELLTPGVAAALGC
jgi:nicotinate-nucleotide adenylyltransferase